MISSDGIVVSTYIHESGLTWYTKRKAKRLARLEHDVVENSQDTVDVEEKKEEVAEDESTEPHEMTKERTEELVEKDTILQSLLKLEKTTKRGRTQSIISKHYYHEVLDVTKKSDGGTAAAPSSAQKSKADNKPAAVTSATKTKGKKRATLLSLERQSPTKKKK